ASARRLDCLPGACEHGENAVAEELALDCGARVVADDGAEGAVEIAGLRAKGGVAEALGEGGRFSDVRKEDDSGAGRQTLGGGLRRSRLVDEVLDETRDVRVGDIIDQAKGGAGDPRCD